MIRSATDEMFHDPSPGWSPPDMPEIKTKSCWTPSKKLFMRKTLILNSCDGAKNNWLYSSFQKIGDFVSDGLARCPTIHIEAMRQN